MLFITGDTHGDFRRFSTDIFPEQRALDKSDFVVVCGDFGVWDDSKQQRYWLDWLNDKPFTTLFVDGNHSNFDILYALPEREWHGGSVHFVRDSVIHLMRGQVFNLGGKRVFTMGGAQSHDISGGILQPDDPEIVSKRRLLDRHRALYRINHVSWWEQELPSDSEYAEAKRNLDACARKVDYIISHCAPTGVQTALERGERYKPDRLTDFLEEIRLSCEFDYWFFGHYHDNKAVGGKYILLYEQIIEVTPG